MRKDNGVEYKKDKLYHAAGNEDKDTRLETDQCDKTTVWQDDSYNRSKFAEDLFTFLKSQTSPLTIGINGEWGCGKTFFLRRFCKSMQFKTAEGKSKSMICVYINSWECDYLENPILQVFQAIAIALLQRKVVTSMTVAKLTNLVLDIGWMLGHGILDKASGGKLSKAEAFLDKIAEIAQKIKDANTDAGEESKLTDDMLKAFSSQTAATKHLMECLSKCAKQVYDKTGFPLVICIDELDRCRPTYTIEMLERIKHIFSVDHVVFILGVDKKNLSESIKSVYGAIDTENYLRRFLNATISLPAVEPSIYFEYLWQRNKIDSAITRHYRLVNNFDEVDQECNSEKVNFIRTLRHVGRELVDRARLSLREVEDVISRYVQFGVADSLPHRSDYIVMLVVAILKVHDTQNVLSRYLASCASVEDVCGVFFPQRGLATQEDLPEDNMLKSALYKIVEASMLQSNEKMGEFVTKMNSEVRIPNAKSAIEFKAPGTKLIYWLNRDIAEAADFSKPREFKFSMSRAQALSKRLSFNYFNDLGWQETPSSRCCNN